MKPAKVLRKEEDFVAKLQNRCSNKFHRAAGKADLSDRGRAEKDFPGKRGFRGGAGIHGIFCRDSVRLALTDVSGLDGHFTLSGIRAGETIDIPQNAGAEACKASVRAARRNLYTKGVDTMAKYIFKRIIMAIVTIFAVASVAFFVMNMVPGGPFMSEEAISPQAQAALKRNTVLTSL